MREPAVTAGAAAPLLSVDGICFSYGAIQVLFDVSFSVAPGEIVALVGSNGAGKSTTLRVVAGLESPSAGTVRFGGADVNGVPAETRVGQGTSLVLGGRAVFGDLAVEENLRIASTPIRKQPGAAAAL